MNWIKGEMKNEKSSFGFKSLRKVVKKAEHQTGTSNKKRDKVRKALPPGKRISRTGKTYYEYRRNRTDMLGEDL